MILSVIRNFHLSETNSVPVFSDKQAFAILEEGEIEEIVSKYGNMAELCVVEIW